MKGHFTPHTIETKRKISIAKIGVKLSEKTKNKMKGRKPWNKGKKMTIEYRQKVSETLKGKYGKLSRNWKGGVTPLQIQLRQSLEYAIWRIEVLKKDNFTCRLCKKRGGKLVAHHLNSFANFPELRFSTDNGIVLCRGCHSKLHNKKVD